MGKLAKQMYITTKGEKKINCYVVNIPKEVVSNTDLSDKELKIYAENGKIIIDKK